MSFGFSPGDVYILVKLVNKIRKAFVDAPAQFRAIQDEVKTLSCVLRDLEDVLPERTLSLSVSQSLQEHISTCDKLLKDLNTTLQKYHALDTKVSKVRRIWHTLRWEPEDIKDLRARLSSNIGLLNSINDLLNRHAVSQIQDGVDKLARYNEDEEFLQITSWLSAMDVAAQHRDLITRRQNDTGHWFLGCHKYRDWLDTPGATLFCPGIPGGGKTMIAAAVIEDLWNKFQSDPGVGIAFIYCSYKRQYEQSMEECLASILKQLLVKLDRMPCSIQNSYHQHKSRLSKPSIQELILMLQTVTSSYSKVYFVVDALDEYCTAPNMLVLFLNEIAQLQLSRDVNFLATSRPNIPNTTCFFEGKPAVEICAKEEDIRKVLENEMPGMPTCISNSPELQDLVKEKIIQAVGEMFLLVRLHLNSLRDKLRRKHVIQALENLPRGQKALDSAYADTIERIDGQQPGCRDLAKRVLMWISHARRPLTITELRYALAVELGEPELDEDNLPEVQDMVSFCEGLVTVDEKSNIIRLVHFTTQEYFDRISDTWMPHSHKEIALTCLTYLSFDEFAKGSHSCSNDKEFEDRLAGNVLLDYSARNWGDHVRDADDQEANQAALKFLGDDLKVTSAVQVRMVSTYHSSGYSKDVPLQIEALHLSAQFGLSKVITQLLADGRNPDPPDDFMRTPLSYAAEYGHENIVKLLTLRPDVKCDFADKSDRTPLSWAAGNSHVDVLQTLLHCPGVDVNSKDSTLQSPLSWAARLGRVAAVKFLLKRSDVEQDSRDWSEQTPLSWAAYNGHLEVVKLLAESPSVDINSKDFFSQTPLSWAAGKGHLGVASYLVNQPSVNPNSRDNEGRSILMWASIRGHLEVVKLLASIPNVEVDAKDHRGQTPLSWAAREGHLEVVKYLMSRSDVNMQSKDMRGMTPQRWAVWNGYEAVAKALAAGVVDQGRKEDDGTVTITKTVVVVTAQAEEGSSH